MRRDKAYRDRTEACCALRSQRLAEHGLTWIHPPAPLAHPFDDGTAVVVEREVVALQHS